MITFVPAWHNVSTGEVSTDDLIGIMQSFQATGEDYRILVSDYLPNLRYFLHRFGLLESNYISLFDQLQGFENISQKPLALEDLGLPQRVHYVYTPFSILVYKDDERIAEVTMREGAHISEVKHYKSSELISVDIYDDRGFLSSRKIFEDNKHFLTEYLDISGRCIFVHFQEDGGCAVNYDNAKGLLRKYYESLEALIFECLEVELRHSSTNKIVLSVNEKNKAAVSRSIFLEAMVLSYFDKKVLLNSDEQYIDRFLVSKSKAVIVDSKRLRHSLSLLTEEKNKIHKISPFDTRFTLSASQEMKEEVLYLDARNMDTESNHQVVRQIFEFICGRTMEEDRSFKLVVRSSPTQKQELENFYSELVRSKYFEEVTLIEELGLDSEGENELEDSFLGELKARVFLVKKLMKSIEIFHFESDEKLFKILHDTRILIDLSLMPDLFTQIAGISSGIPQINSEDTEYVHNQKNGSLLKDVQKLPDILSYYLDSLKHWQEARVHSVQLIKYYSGVVLCEKLIKLF